MWKPDENLDDYIVKPIPEDTSDTPRSVSLRATGDVEVLKPLTLVEIRATRAGFNAPYQPLWFRRFVAVGSVALVMIALVLMSAILVGINDPAGEPDVVTNVTPYSEPAQPEELFSVEVPSSLTPVRAIRGVRIVRSNPRRRAVRPSFAVAAIKPRHQSPPPLHFELPKFVPTTLVIFAENGVINTRIEPWLQDSN